MTAFTPKHALIAPNQAFNSTSKLIMSEKKTNLNDFFKKENKKKPAAKPKASTGKQQAETSAADHDKQDFTKDTKNSKQQKADYESSEEEKTDLITGEEQSTLIKDKKEIQAQKRKQQQEQEQEGSGWKALESHDKPSTYTKDSAAPQRTLLGA